MSKFLKLFAIALMLTSCNAKDDNLSEMIITTSDGDVVYQVETATTKEEMAQGLMDRKELRADSGMVFHLDGAKDIAMWMKDTYVALDMLFVNQEGKIIWIYENAEPLSTNLIQPAMSEPLSVVVEINAGDVQKHNIKIGDTLKHFLIEK
ncbi:MAG: DUF192 domain-containing protein [Alphaproteobacteria bacterium]|nr:DUF192 domain-containing protein [Alphaproteobacteria bacterium]